MRVGWCGAQQLPWKHSIPGSAGQKEEAGGRSWQPFIVGPIANVL